MARRGLSISRFSLESKYEAIMRFLRRGYRYFALHDTIVGIRPCRAKWGQKCWEVSTSRGRRFVGGMGSGSTGGGGLGDAVSLSHRAQWGLCVKPSKGLGSLERSPLGLR